jgi:3-deoxy-D-manno-octulosonic-acid transferase
LNTIAKFAFRLYGLGWQIALPFLKMNSRLAEGFDQRRYGPSRISAPIDIWIQAASAGESYLATAILEQISTENALKILVTTNTRQGLDILNTFVSAKRYPLKKIYLSYFPFDKPPNMANVVRRLTPRVTVLLETEIWPGLLLALKKKSLPAIILNGRLTSKSLKHYLIYPSPFRAVAPQKIAAISKADADRFGQLFPDTPVTTMSNIKFDRTSFPDSTHPKQNALEPLFGRPSNLIVLGSIRAEEESLVIKIISKLLRHLPHIRIALFPRHMHRLDAWQDRLNQSGHPWIRRSAINQPVAQGMLILWDTFGELAAAYALAKTVFVGGSLADLGGQNFLEPLSYGVRPVIGPYWENFFWIGQKILSKQLVIRCNDWQAVTTALINDFNSPVNPEQLKTEAQTYIKARQGGTRTACAIIDGMLIRKN